MPDQSLKIKFAKIKGYSLVNIRLVWNSLAFVHLAVTGVMTLNIDVTGDEDPLIRAYNCNRWKLLTCLFNIAILAYLPLCLYCDWCEKRGEEPPHVERLRGLRDVVMTSILMPFTTFADVTFWIMLKSHLHLLAPLRVFDEYFPYWAQYSLHTASLVTVIVDLLLTPRRRPDSMKPRLVLMLGLASAYCLMVYVELLRGQAVYAFVSTASNTLLVAVSFSIHVLLTIYYYAQWHIIDYVWGQKGMKKKLVKNS